MDVCDREPSFSQTTHNLYFTFFIGTTSAEFNIWLSFRTFKMADMKKCVYSNISKMKDITSPHRTFFCHILEYGENLDCIPMALTELTKFIYHLNQNSL